LAPALQGRQLEDRRKKTLIDHCFEEGPSLCSGQASKSVIRYSFELACPNCTRSRPEAPAHADTHLDGSFSTPAPTPAAGRKGFSFGNYGNSRNYGNWSFTPGAVSFYARSSNFGNFFTP
jgi:hypothetical protein